MRRLIAVATDKDGKKIWRGHFGMSPFYTVFDEDGNFVEKRVNPYAKEGKHHDDPNLIVNLLSDVSLFIAKNMGHKSREKLTKELGVKSILVDLDNIDEALRYYLDVKRNVDVFERCHEKYEEWFDKYDAVYKSELELLKSIMPKNAKKSIEIGVGSGRFAEPLGIKEGVEPSSEMSKIASQRGIKVYPGFAEDLPLSSEIYDFALIAVTICFVKDRDKTLSEIYRILKPKGKIAVAIVDRDTEIGKEYLNKQQKGQFYKTATFFSTKEIVDLLKKHNFKVEKIGQTLFGDSMKTINEFQLHKEGFGEGGFVVILGEKI